MSVMQVVGSSRISNTIYLAVGSIYWTWILDLTGTTLNLTIETVLVIVTPAAAIAAVLWSFKFEKQVITRLILLYKNHSSTGGVVRYLLARTLIFIKPWQSSALIERDIKGTLKREVERVLDNIHSRKEMEVLEQLFWLVVSVFPLVYLLGSLSQMIRIYYVMWSIILILFLSSPILYRKRNRPQQVLYLALCRWIHETIKSDTRRRESISGFRQLTAAHDINFREMLQTWTRDLVTLTEEEDWDGFQHNLQGLLLALSNRLPFKLMKSDFSELIRDFLWFYRSEREFRGEFSKFDTVEAIQSLSFQATLLNTVMQLHYATIELRQFVVKGDLVFRKIRRIIRDKDILIEPENWEQIYLTSGKKSIEYLDLNAMTELAELPQILNDPHSKPTLIAIDKGKQKWSLNLAFNLLRDAENNLLSPQIAIRAITQWGVMPVHYLAKLEGKMRRLLLENKFDIPDQEWASVFKRILMDTPEFDFEEVAKNISMIQDDNANKQIRTDLLKLTGEADYKKRAVHLLEILQPPSK